MEKRTPPRHNTMLTACRPTLLLLLYLAAALTTFIELIISSFMAWEHRGRMQNEEHFEWMS
jgi:hypothetical protein